MKSFIIFSILMVLGSSLVAVMNSRVYTIHDLFDETNTEDMEYAINQEFRKLWEAKVDISTGNTIDTVRFQISDILDEDNSEENSYALNENFKDLWENKENNNDSVGFIRYTIQDIANKELAEENEMAINQNFEDLWLSKLDK